MARFAAALLCVLALGIEASAQTRSETLRWQQPSTSPAFTGFKVYWSASGGTSGNRDVGLPTPQSGVYSSVIPSLPDTADVTFTMTAYNAQGLESTASNSICRGPGGAACGSTPPPPPPPPGGGTPLAAVTGFRLWDASTDTLIDNDFVDNDAISGSCVAIEIVGNAYLQAGSGSVIKQLDNNAPTGCESVVPFGWEDGSSSGFECATSLQNAGTSAVTHTLRVTTYDGNNCTGTAGTPVPLTFSVAPGQAPPPPPAPLGQPGKPELVP